MSANAVASSPAAAKPVPAPISTAPAEPAACAQSLHIDGTMKMNQWKPVLAAVAAAVDAHDAAEDAKVAHRCMLGNLLIAAAVAVPLALLFFGLPGVLSVIVFVGLLATGIVIRSRAPRLADPIGSERIEFVADLLDQLGRIAPGARVALAAQVDCRRAFAAASARDRTAGAKTIAIRSAGECWLRGKLTGLKGLTLGWSVIETNTLKHAHWRNARGKSKSKLKFSTARRFALRLDADGALFGEKITASTSTDPSLVIEVRTQPQGISVRGRWDAKAGGVLHGPAPDAPLGQWRRSAKDAGLAALTGADPAPLVQLMMRCEQRLAPREFKRKVA